MNLNKKKQLAIRALSVGRDRIVFNTERLDEIKEAITKQDIKDLKASGAIFVKEVKGRRTKIKRKTRRRVGTKRRALFNRKKAYMTITRKLRMYLSYLKKTKQISNETFKELRKEVKASFFKSLNQMKEKISEGKK